MRTQKALHFHCIQAAFGEGVCISLIQHGDSAQAGGVQSKVAFIWISKMEVSWRLQVISLF